MALIRPRGKLILVWAHFAPACPRFVSNGLFVTLGSEGFLGDQCRDQPDGNCARYWTRLTKAVIGGTDYGHHTLTRFFALHAGVLPGLVIALVVGHIYLFRKHGICSKKPHRKPDAAFWPDQMLKDAVACLAVLATVMLLILRHWILDREAGLGASLGAPADPSEPYSAARPDWYFLFLFQMLKCFQRSSFRG